MAQVVDAHVLYNACALGSRKEAEGAYRTFSGHRCRFGTVPRAFVRLFPNQHRDPGVKVSKRVICVDRT